MFDENQLVKMQWNCGTKTRYESMGYVFTKLKDIFYVKAKDLSPSSNKIVNVICDYCGKEFEKNYYWIDKSRKRGNKDCCSDCRGKKKSENDLRKNAKEQFDKLEKVCVEQGYKLITTIDEYAGVSMKVKYICPKHGEQETELRILTMGCGCFECGNDKIAKSRTLDVDYIKEVITSDGNIWINPDEYIGYGETNLKIRCKCGNIYTTSFASYIHYNVTRCPQCSQKESKAETRIKTFLNCNNILFEQERSFRDCRDVHALPFDFYLSEHNCCIEFNGKQHYEPIKYFGGEENFVIRQKHDEIKFDYCNRNNIKLICIPYWEEDNIEEILMKELNL